MIRRSGGVTVIVVDAEITTPPTPDLPSESGHATPTTIAGLLTAAQVLLWDDPVTRDVIFRQMVRVLANGVASPDAIVQKLLEREQTGSTFLNEGVALPHARIEGLLDARIALGITQAGVVDSPSQNPIEVVFMLLSPTEGAKSHLQILAKAARLLQNRELRKRLNNARTPQQALEEIKTWEQSESPPTK